jgi:hypothetical protein
MVNKKMMGNSKSVSDMVKDMQNDMQEERLSGYPIMEKYKKKKKKMM